MRGLWKGWCPGLGGLVPGAWEGWCPGIRRVDDRGLGEWVLGIVKTVAGDEVVDSIRVGRSLTKIVEHVIMQIFLFLPA